MCRAPDILELFAGPEKAGDFSYETILRFILECSGTVISTVTYTPGI